MHFGNAADCVTTSSSQNFKVNGIPKSPSTSTTFCGSEANAVVNNFFALAPAQQQDILNFLRSL
jgi:hypothetical protein